MSPSAAPVAYPALQAPLTLAGLRLKNRLAHASMSTLLAKNAGVSDALLNYYRNRALGGAAMIVTEPLSLARHQDVPHLVRAWNNDAADGLKRWADTIESQDCRLLGQLMDRGRGRNSGGRNPNAIGASRAPDDLSWSVPRALTAGEVRALIENFVEAAGRLQRCGFSGIELSAAHGHLIHQFLSPWSNLREDEYGGDLAGRTRLLNEITDGIRARCGARFIIGLKLPGDDGIPGSVDPAQAAAIAASVTAAGHADYVCFAQGSHGRSLEMHVPDDHTPRMPYLPLIRRLRAAVPGVPMMALGRITDPAEADALLARGDAELVGLGRALVTDPAWLNKAAAGRAHDIRYCVSCNTCWERITALRQTIACDNNPRVAQLDEADWRPTHASARKRIAVVGAGIAGLEAAWVAAARGHEVIVFSRAGEVGGKARLRAQLPGGESLSSIYDYQFAAARRAGVRFELGVAATADDIARLKPDKVLIATGASMLPPPWLPAEALAAGLAPDLRSAMAGLLRVKLRQNGTAVVFDMDHTEGTYAAVERLHALFARVVLITPRDTIATEASLVTRQGILRRFAQARIEVVALAEPCWSARVEEGVLEYQNVYTGDRGRIDDLALFTWSTPRAPDDALCEPLRAAGFEVQAIGDALSARNVLAATSEGHAAGNAV